jgi:hypothetical protein
MASKDMASNDMASKDMASNIDPRAARTSMRRARKPMTAA